MANISKERKRENWLRENVKNVDALHVLARNNLFFLSPFQMPMTRGLCVVWFRNNANCIQSGFLLLQKEAKTRQ